MDIDELPVALREEYRDAHDKLQLAISICQFYHGFVKPDQVKDLGINHGFGGPLQIHHYKRKLKRS